MGSVKSQADNRSRERTPGERDLVFAAAILDKDRKATAEFVGRYTDSIYSYVRHRLIPRSDLVDDLVQDVFLAAWDNLDKFRGASSLQAWLLGIARHKVESYYRARLREPDPIESDRDSDSVPVDDPQLEEVLDRERMEARTRRVLESLPETYSLALLWRYWEKRSARDIARDIGKTEKAVERTLARARDQFRRRWNHGE